MTGESNRNNSFSSEAAAALAKEAGLSLSGWQQEVSRGLEFGLEARYHGPDGHPGYLRARDWSTLYLPPTWIPDGGDPLRPGTQD
ncbi:MAG: hypothetical protein Q6K80_00590 [Thermostichus sp. DG_1_6_bins_120]